MEVAIKQFISSLSNNTVKTITVDHDKEFSCYYNVESQFDVNVYFTEPYSSCSVKLMKILMGYLENFFLRKQTWQRSLKMDWIMLLTLLTIDLENILIVRQLMKF